jgi:hypothetical protein
MAKNSSSTTGSTQYQDSSSYTSSSSVSDRISDLGETASNQIDNSPIIAVGAGLALGAVLGAVLPASRKERELLGPVGSRVTDKGQEAVDRAREMGKQKFDEMAGDKVREFFGMGESSSESTNA